MDRGVGSDPPRAMLAILIGPVFAAAVRGRLSEPASDATRRTFRARMLADLTLRGYRVRRWSWELDLAIPLSPRGPRTEAVEVRLDRLLEILWTRLVRGRQAGLGTGRGRRNLHAWKAQEHEQRAVQRTDGCAPTGNRLSTSIRGQGAGSGSCRPISTDCRRLGSRAGSGRAGRGTARVVGLGAMANGLDNGCGQGTSLVHQILLHVVPHNEDTSHDRRRLKWILNS